MSSPEKKKGIPNWVYAGIFLLQVIMFFYRINAGTSPFESLVGSVVSFFIFAVPFMIANFFMTRR